jgi:23S rRNA G2069 N7-methylase RlmK/C1962 C5-methylase RlmI
MADYRFYEVILVLAGKFRQAVNLLHDNLFQKINTDIMRCVTASAPGIVGRAVEIFDVAVALIKVKIEVFPHVEHFSNPAKILRSELFVG